MASDTGGSQGSDSGTQSSGTAFGALIAGGFNVRGQKRANKAAKKEAERNRKWQKEMSDTAYQRGMKDMRKAGLNPMLAFSQGGASSPMGSVAPVGNIYGSLAEDVMSGVSAATNVKKAHDSGNLMSRQKRHIDAQTLATEALAHKTAQETNTSAATERKIDEETGLLRSQIPYRSDKAYGDIPWSGKIKRAWDQKRGLIKDFSRGIPNKRRGPLKRPITQE